MFVTLTAGALLSGNSYAQTDSVSLEPVNIKGFVPEKFMSGLKIQQIDSAILYTYKFQNISELLSVFTPIAFNKYGPGQLTTAFFRGTSANHTAVLWNGLNINSPILGQTDFSTIPVAGFDAMSVQFGSASSIVGTDAVGGSILLSSIPQNQTNEASVAGQIESFDNYQMQLAARYHSVLNEKWSISGKTSGYFNRMNNHFPYRERREYALLPAEADQKGLIQDIFLTSKNDQEISAHVWLTGNKLVTSPANLVGRELTLTEAYRTMLRYRIRDLTLRTAWVRDVIDYAKGDFENVDHAVTDKFSTRAEQDFTWNLNNLGSNIYIKAGAEWTHYRTSVAGYEKPLITEDRADIFLLTRWQANRRLVVSLNLRQALVTGYNPPFTPSIGSEYQLFQRNSYQLKLKGSLARSYRVPTLNERYWAVLGNPDIKPESGWNKEIGLEQSLKSTFGDVFTASITGYHNRVKDWTYWNPTKNYRVENLQQVLARGLELQLSWRRDFGAAKSGLNFNYAWNKSVQEKAYDAYSVDVIGKQLRFVPLHSAGLNTFFQYKNMRLTAQVQSVGKRYITFDNSTFLKEYALVHLIGEVTIPLSAVYLRVQGQINNVSNTFYLNTQNNAMPGRSFAINMVAAFRKGPKRLPILEN
ncbi:TonB-dependent siderophore receptor [Dyadobacter sp. CY343]|uniref:TonB-dependent receptor plug domain-containing protein n=1 Tax=Dyadobacter sp. CY343 TaxID=2907299 RepID=UPI001F38A34B|nr:TonB-dependent receptor [Dyadobacter sp. CY343]MCE7062479.1 TonB-dependent receptor [Dyadobacter sp. CY343]